MIIHSVSSARIVIIIIVIEAELVEWTRSMNCCSVRHEQK